MKRFGTKGFFLVCILFGFMIAVQYNSVHKKEEVIETKDTWELRQALLTAQNKEAELLKEIQKTDQIIAQYESEKEHSSLTILQKTLNDLRKEAGLKAIEGPGIVIHLSVADEAIIPGESEVFISPDILRKLINELNMYGSLAIAISDQRVVQSTAIRIIQGETKIDGYPLRNFPIEIKAITKDRASAEKLYNYMQISNLADDFFVDNLKYSVSIPNENIVIPAYDHEITVKIMENVLEEGEK